MCRFVTHYYRETSLLDLRAHKKEGLDYDSQLYHRPHTGAFGSDHPGAFLFRLRQDRGRETGYLDQRR
ncbi:hypothetical protein D3C78_1721770 [compost metagenome]